MNIPSENDKKCDSQTKSESLDTASRQTQKKPQNSEKMPYDSKNPSLELQALLHNSHLPILKGMKEQDISSLLANYSSGAKTLLPGEYLFHQGDSFRHAGILVSGQLLVIQEDFWGHRNILARIRSGQLFAETFACCPGQTVTVSAVADTRCEILLLDIGRILTTSAAQPSCPWQSLFLQNLLQDMAGKIQLLNAKITCMGQRTTRQKLLSYLSLESAKRGKAEFDIPFDRQQLADYLSVERSALSATLSLLQREGVLTCHRQHFVLHVTTPSE